MKIHFVSSALVLARSIWLSDSADVQDAGTCSQSMSLLQHQLVIGGKDEEFRDYVASRGRSYVIGSSEYIQRQALFQRRLEDIAHQNSRRDKLWTAAVNHFTDHTEEELSALRGWKGRAAIRRTSLVQGVSGASSFTNSNGSTAVAKDMPESWSWVGNLSTLNTVRDQGGCGSCWATCGTTVLDAHVELHYPESPNVFSTQELVNCVQNEHDCGGLGGCSGATLELAYDYVLRYGLVQASTIPYTGYDGLCSHSVTPAAQTFQDAGVYYASDDAPSLNFGMYGFDKLPMNEYEPLLQAVYEHGPVAVSVAADAGWSYYGFGVYNGCSKDAVVNHAVTLVGYGTSDADYWLIQNSWGSGWGEAGRMRIKRHSSSDAWCGTDHQPEWGLGCDGGPSAVQVCGMCAILYDSVLPLVKHP